MKATLVAVAAAAIAISAAACSGGGGGGGGGNGHISSGTYTTSNSRYSPDGCNAAAQQPASAFDGQTLVVTSNGTGLDVNGLQFNGSGSSFAAATVSTNNDLSGFGIDCVLHLENASSIVAHGDDMFTIKQDVKASRVSGAQCSATGLTLPCESAILSDAAK